ncbi:hypothetical protein ZWY2020_041440 [Hordeum vulgare]|nr:hypothetical protein ZWY2020_041440 [Hordeum vulgare]
MLLPLPPHRPICLLLLHHLHTAGQAAHRVQPTSGTSSTQAQLGSAIMAIKKGGAAGLKQILKRCSSLGRRQQQQQQSHGWEEEEEAAPSDVPRGHFAVYVGESRRRFVVPIAVLDRPEFRSLLRRAEEEFGFGGAGDLLVLPCEELAFRSLCSASSLPCAAAR